MKEWGGGWMKGRQGSGEMKEGRQVGREHGVKDEDRAWRGMQVGGEHGVREGVKVGREGDNEGGGGR